MQSEFFDPNVSTDQILLLSWLYKHSQGKILGLLW